MRPARTMIVTVALGVVTASSFATEMPMVNKGIESVPLHMQSLQKQIPVMAGYVLRSRRVTLAPGGSVKRHPHADRPGFLYVLEGELTEYRGDSVKTVGPGDSWTESGNTVHGVKNNTDKPAVAIVVDIIREKPSN